LGRIDNLPAGAQDSGMGHTITDPAIIAKLDTIIDMVKGLDARLRGVEDGLAELRGEVRQMSVRISDVNARLPVPIAYQPPAPGKKRA